jgi:hypothetical protein
MEIIDWIYSLFSHSDETPINSFDVDEFTHNVYQPRQSISINIRKQEGINSNWKYRQYLQKHGDQIDILNNVKYSQNILPVHTSFLQNPTLCDSNNNISQNKKSDSMKSYLYSRTNKARMVAPIIRLPE